MHAPQSPALRIIHVVRAPVGGLFRHVRDLAAGQAERGHAVGLVADSLTGGERAAAMLAELAPHLILGIHRLPIARDIGPSDLVGLARMSRVVRAAAPQVLHGHGAKGGACARLASVPQSCIRAYTPHGGSLHYAPGTLRGRVYGVIERLLMARTDLLLFESAYARSVYTANIGRPRGLARVVCNGVGEDEFTPVQPRPEATDLVFVGELRRLKGVDVLLAALALLGNQGRPVTLSIVGEGPDGDAFRAQAKQFDMHGRVRFLGYRHARDAFGLGRILVVPSRNESLPYIVLEAAAAGVPLIATSVGGIPDVFGPQAHRLVPPGDATALAAAITDAFDDRDGSRAAAAALRERVRQSFSVDGMVSGVIEAYREAINAYFLASQ